MILNCEACGKRYMIKDGLIKDKPKKVRCTSCGHTWMQNPAQETLPESPASIVNEKPVIEHRDNKFVILITTLLIALLFSVLILCRYEIVKYVPVTKGAYEALNLSTKKPGEGLKFNDIHSIAEAQNGKQFIYVTGSIINTTKEVIHVPAVEFYVLGKCPKEGSIDGFLSSIGLGTKKIDGMCVLKSWKMSLTENKLMTGEKVQFETDKHPLPVDAQSVVVRF